MHNYRLITALLVGCLTPSCAGVLRELGAGRKRNGWDEVSAAIRTRDEAKLKVLCEDESLGLRDKEPRKGACWEHESIQLDKDTGDCTTVVERFRKARKLRDELELDFYPRWADRVAKCERYKEIFEDFAHLGETERISKALGLQILQRLEQNGVPLFAAFGRYAKENPGPAFLNIKPAGSAGNHLAIWLIEGKHLDQCSLLAKTLTDSSEAARSSMLFYFVEAKCKPEGTVLARSLLTAKSDLHRITACRTLGEIGGASVVNDLRTLSESDSFFVVQEARGSDGRVYGAKVFTVRDACKDAATKIRLTSNRK